MERKEKKRHFLPCPNCRDNLFQKRSQSVPFLQEGANIFLVQACVDCLSHPETLDEERIAISLMAEEWPENVAKRAARTLIEEARKRVSPPEPVSVERIPVSTVIA